ncbi:YcgL domain-containing protein [Arhodomonas sp. AD133]|uniref:YcgL domain-containing protein n=1 Tax=Arhodomonas sp. AD133 TaxID=3415009 RepID=UPI003EBEE22D
MYPRHPLNCQSSVPTGDNWARPTTSRRDDIAGVPDALLDAMGRLELVMELTIHPGRRLARVRAVEVLDGLLHRGCFVQLPPDDDVMPFGGANRTKH